MSLNTKLEKAFVQVVRDIADFPSDTVHVYRGTETETQVAPCVVCWCKGGPEEPMGSGNRRMQMTIVVKANAKKGRKGDGSDLEPIVSLNELSELVFDSLKNDDLPERLTTAIRADGDTGTVYEPIEDTGFDPDFADVSFRESLTFSVYCCDADV